MSLFLEATKSVLLRYSKHRNLIFNTGVAIADQGLFSGSNFLLNVLLARWLSERDYGVFAVVFSIFLFLSGFHNALILEPLTILGPAKYSNVLRSYIISQIKIHFLLTGTIGFIVTLAGFILGFKSELGQSIISAGIALPFMLLIWLVRRIYYVLQFSLGAMICSGIYAILIIAGLIFVPNKSPSNAFIILGISSFVSAVIALVWSVMHTKDVFPNVLNLKDVINSQWLFGKPIVLAVFLFTFGSQIQVFLIGSLIDLQTAGVWRALQNFALPMVQVITAISTFTLPTLSIEFGGSRFKELQEKGYRNLLVLIGLALVYEIILFSFGPQIEQILYNGKLISYVWAIPYIGLATLLTAAEVGYSTMIRSFQKPVYHAVYGLIGAISGLIFAPLLIVTWGLKGAVVSQLIVGIFVLCSTIIMYFRWFPLQETNSIIE
jgi:O-antigen/teichoic acid export membrane protein